MSRKSKVPAPCCAVTTYSPITAASMINPPNRLYSKNFTAALSTLGSAAEAANEEVHRNEHGFEEHVEEQDVKRDKRDQHHGLDRQYQRNVGVGARGGGRRRSFQPARISTGTSAAVRSTSTSAMPSTPRE